MLQSNLSDKEFGIDSKNYNNLQQTIEKVIHCAAFPNFKAEFHAAYKDNVICTGEIVKFCNGCVKDVKLIHISTAYVQSHKNTICQLRSFIDMHEDHFDNYTRTKLIAEHAVFYNARCRWSIVRPSMISPAWEFPYKGFFSGNGAIIGACMLYISHLLNVLPYSSINAVPCDYVSRIILHELFSEETMNFVPAISDTIDMYELVREVNKLRRFNVIYLPEQHAFVSNIMFQQPILFMHGEIGSIGKDAYLYSICNYACHSWTFCTSQLYSMFPDFNMKEYIGLSAGVGNDILKRRV
jgi:hypothetical protein